MPGPAAFVLGDGPLIRQLISNLVDNAIKFTEEGEIVVGVRHSPGVARITVSDSGVGIEPETAERLFDRFFPRRSVALAHDRRHWPRPCDRAQHRARSRRHGQRRAAAGRRLDLTVTLPALDVPPGDPLLTEIQ